MSAVIRYYYLRDNSFNTSGEIDSMFFTESSTTNNLNVQENNNNCNDNNEEKDYDEAELMPFTPSSADRSSVGSIPWADDAIKKNQLDWERIERMLAGTEAALLEEPELAQEILEWQQKFPQLITKKAFAVQPQHAQDSRNNFDDFLDIDILSNASQDSSDNELADDYLTPTLQHYKESKAPRLLQSDKRQRKSSVADLAHLLSRNVRISSVPLTWRSRQSCYKRLNDNEESDRSSTSPVHLLPPQPPPRRQSPSFNALIIAPTASKLQHAQKTAEQFQTRNRFSPILNVLDTKRRFRGLANNRSFVQLTQLQQPNSALQNAERYRKSYQPTAWHVPLAAAASRRFLSNRNSVLLPAINLGHIHDHRAIDAPTSATSSSSLSPRDMNSLQEGILQEPAFYLQNKNVLPRRSFISDFPSVTPSTSGRSISAAVHHSRTGISAFYLPYSAATKFKSFNKI